MLILFIAIIYEILIFTPTFRNIQYKNTLLNKIFTRLIYIIGADRGGGAGASKEKLWAS